MEEEKLTKSISSNKRKRTHEISKTEIDQLSRTGSSLPNEKSDEFSKLREISRRQYLEKRERKEVELLEKSLKDDEELFGGENLTKQELQRRKINKKIVEVASDKSRFSFKDDFYRIPVDNGKVRQKGFDAIQQYKRYEEETIVKTDQELWEENRLKQLASSSSNPLNNQHYDYVFEDPTTVLSRNLVERDNENHSKLSKKHFESTIIEKDISPSDQQLSYLDRQKLVERNKMEEIRKKLPVFAYREEFLQAVRDHKILIVVGETGSGKTTQLPQYLHEAGWTKLGKIGCTQPRRVAAMSVAARVSSEMGVKLGHEVGYSIRFEDCTNDQTIIKYMTDGMLLREMLAEPDMKSYSIMIIDEAHERTLHTDVLFGLVKDISRFRQDDFRLIISSATLDAEKFSNYFDQASIFLIPGKMYHVDIYYSKTPEADYLDAAIVSILQIHITQPLPGDILVFLTGQEEIETAIEILNHRIQTLGSKINEIMLCPIYSNLPSEMQARIFEPVSGKEIRKVVLATNIAETSLTIDGICYVIDCGFAKQKSFNPRTGMESLIVTPISKAAANQRKGRAGRTQAGKCFRLYTAWSFQYEMEDNTVPEIQRTNMGNVVLMMKSLGINDLLNFDFMDKPPAESLIRALEQLYALGALNDRGELTKLGRKMAEFPLDPMMSKVLIASDTFSCTAEVITILSMLSIGSSVFYRPKDKVVHADTARFNFARQGGGDLGVLLRCYNEWAETDYSTQWCYENYIQYRSVSKARDVREQLEGLCERVEINQSSNYGHDMDAIAKAFTSGYFYNVAKFSKEGVYKLVKSKNTVHIHPSSVLMKDLTAMKNQEDNDTSSFQQEQRLVHHPYLLFHELTFTTKEYIRSLLPINGEWLLELAPHYYAPSDILDEKIGKVKK
jgi:pre-mRNA-splicing factor ATP-dependent RNA helicase DHX16